MAATLISSIITDARVELKETTARFWTDAELLAHAKKCVNDLWGAMVDLNQEHYITVDETLVSLAANTSTLTGVPTDVFRVLLIEPRDTTSTASGGGTLFVPRKFNHPDFINARQLTALDVTTNPVLCYTVTQAGSPVGAPTIRVAPQLSGALLLRFVYVPGPASAALTTASGNPIPGESDNALMAWMIAYARSKEREDRSPDPAWLTIYATEKQSLLTRMTPRQTQETEHVADLFQSYL